jgi:hypothetical protein
MHYSAFVIRDLAKNHARVRCRCGHLTPTSASGLFGFAAMFKQELTFPFCFCPLGDGRRCRQCLDIDRTNSLPL